MSELGGLRARKKAAARRHIADVAAQLFGEPGFEQVSVSAIARAADVSEQTVYNYFPTKMDLVLDLADEIERTLADDVRHRPVGVTPAAGVRDALLTVVEQQRRGGGPQSRGELPTLTARSTMIRRLALEANHRQADAIAAAIVETNPGTAPLAAHVQAAALVDVLTPLVDVVGRRLVAGDDGPTITDDLRAEVEEALDQLDRAQQVIGLARPDAGAVSP